MLGVFLDTETNGLNAFTHKILEIAYKIVDLETGTLKKEYHATISQPMDAWEKSDAESLQINRFTFTELQQGVTTELVAQTIIDDFVALGIVRKKAVFICQNPSFDRAFFSQLITPETQERLQWPYHWLDLASMYWALAIKEASRDPNHLPWITGFSKDLIAAHYHLKPEAKPHRAMNGVDHLLLCYTAVVGFPKKDSPKSLS